MFCPAKNWLGVAFAITVFALAEPGAQAQCHRSGLVNPMMQSAMFSPLALQAQMSAFQPSLLLAQQQALALAQLQALQQQQLLQAQLVALQQQAGLQGSLLGSQPSLLQQGILAQNGANGPGALNRQPGQRQAAQRAPQTPVSRRPRPPAAQAQTRN